MIKNKTSKSTENNYTTTMIGRFSDFLEEILSKGGDATGLIYFLFMAYVVSANGEAVASPFLDAGRRKS